LFYGHLTDDRGREFAIHLGFYRLALSPTQAISPSAWSTNEVYRAYFSLTDVAAARFYAEERFARAALGLSGSESSPPRVWVEDWGFELKEPAGELTMVLSARQDSVSVDLEMRAVKALLLESRQPQNSTSESAAAPFHFYVAPRLEAVGSVMVGERTYPIQGNVWFDRAWGELPVPGGPVAANRFIVTLDNDSELSCLQLHRRSASRAPQQSCILIGTDGETTFLSGPALELEALGSWVSPRDGSRYPAGWRLVDADSGIDLVLEPLVEDQEANLSLRIWGGAVAVSGYSEATTVKGKGYVELSGYESEP
jgi:predicted secreted hydrolase